MDEQEIADEQQRFKAIILSTCTALGGHEEYERDDGTIERVYTAGDEALACLKDLKRFIRVDNFTTSTALAEFNILERDLLPLILTHARQKTELGERFILACVELLVPMTWPLPNARVDDDDETGPNMLNRYREYKLALLTPGVCEAVLNLVLKPIAKPYQERTTRDPLIIRLVLYFIRNLAAIPDTNSSQIGSDKQLLMASMQEALLIRLCESSFMDIILALSVAEESEVTERLVVLEIMYNLLERVSPKDVFLEKADQATQNAPHIASKKLSRLMEEEHKHKRLKTRYTPSRHNRFGGTYVVQGWDGDKFILHKQEAGYADLGQLINADKKEDRRGHKRKLLDELSLQGAYREPRAFDYLKQVAQSFLESYFNGFYLALMRDLQREDKSIAEKDHLRFYYTMSWLLEYLGYERAAAQKSAEPTVSTDELILPSRSGTEPREDEEDNDRPTFDFALVANVMETKVFFMCSRRLRIALDDKLWLDAQVVADCLRQLLLTVRAMAKAPEEEHRQVAEYIQSNIYHEQSALDLYIDLIRRYKNQSYGYLRSVVQLTHVMLKLLEQYANSKKVMFVRKKKARGKGTTATQPVDVGQEESEADEEDERNWEEEREQQLAYREHVFKFESFEAKYTTDDVVRAYCELLNHYQTLDADVLHAITTLFHRIMVKRKVEHLFFKLPVLELFNRILMDVPILPKTSAFSQLVQFIRYCTRQFFKRASDYPLLYVEALFKNARVSRPLTQERRTKDDEDDDRSSSSDSEDEQETDAARLPNDPLAGLDLDHELDLALAERDREREQEREREREQEQQAQEQEQSSLGPLTV